MTSYEDEIDLSDLWKAIGRRKVLVVVATLVPGILALLVALLQPKMYVTAASVLPIRYQSDAAEVLAAGVAAQAGPMEALLGGFSAIKAPDLVGVLHSRALAERVVKTYQLHAAYKQVFGSEDVLDQLDEMVTIVPANQSRAVTIQVEAPNPELAATIANGYVTELEAVMEDFARQRARKSIRVIETQLEKTRQELAKAEQELSRGESEKARHQAESVDGRWFTQQEIGVLKTSYQTLLKQYEAASLAETKGAEEFLSLDKASVPSEPKPSRTGVFVGIGLLIGLALGVAAAIMAERSTLLSQAGGSRRA